MYFLPFNMIARILAKREREKKRKKRRGKREKRKEKRREEEGGKCCTRSLVWGDHQSGW